MRVLGIETSTFIGSVACVEDGVLLAESTLDVRQTHTAVLLPTVDRVLQDVDWTIDNVEGFGVSLGPGSFTSLRIGLATVKGLAAKHSVPVAGIETLYAMAFGRPAPGALVMPVIDARQSEHYTARFRWRDDVLVEETRPVVGPIETLFAAVHEPVWCPGDVDDDTRARIEDTTGRLVYIPEPRLCGARGAAIAQLAAAKIAENALPPAAGLAPLYLRDHLGHKPAA